MSPELRTAIKERVELGHSQEQITAELREAGYDDAAITAMYNATVSPAPIPVATELPSAITLFKQAWAFALSRPDLLVLLAVPTLFINGAAVALEQGWLAFDAQTIVGLVLGFLAIVFLQFVLQLTVAHTALTTQQSGQASLEESWQWAIKNVWSWLWIATLSFCVVFGGLILFIIPGVIISFYIAFAMYVFIDQDTQGMSALQRSRALVTGHFWDILTRFIVFILIVLGLSLLFGVVMALLAGLLGATNTGLGGMVVSLFDAVLTAFVSLLGVYFAASLYSALTLRLNQTVAPSAAYPVLGWFGAVVLLAILALSLIGAAAYINEGGLAELDFEQMMNAETNTQTIETPPELSPEEQAEFDAFMDEFGAELDSF